MLSTPGSNQRKFSCLSKDWQHFERPRASIESQCHSDYRDKSDSRRPNYLVRSTFATASSRCCRQLANCSSRRCNRNSCQTHSIRMHRSLCIRTPRGIRYRPNLFILHCLNSWNLLCEASCREPRNLLGSHDGMQKTNHRVVGYINREWVSIILTDFAVITIYRGQLMVTYSSQSRDAT